MEHDYQVTILHREGHGWEFRIERLMDGPPYRLKEMDFEKLGGEFPELRRQYRAGGVRARSKHTPTQTIPVKGTGTLEHVRLKHTATIIDPTAFRFARSSVPLYSSATTERVTEPLPLHRTPASLPSRAHAEPSGMRASYGAVLHKQTVTVCIGWTMKRDRKLISWRGLTGETVYGFTHAESNHPSNRPKIDHYRTIALQGVIEIPGQTLYLERPPH